MALIVVVFGVATVLASEHYPASKGLGDDGVAYAAIANQFGHLVRTRAFDSYDIWRIVPCAIVWAALRTLGIAGTPHTIFMSFRWLNLLELIGVVYLLNAVTTCIGFDKRARWFAFVGLFGSFCALKWFLYDPVLIDCSGYFLAAALLWAFVTRRIWALALVTLIAGFTWQFVFFAGVALLVLPREATFASETSRSRRAAWGLTTLITVAAFVLLHFLPDHIDASLFGIAPPWRNLYFVSGVITAVWIGVATFPLLRELLAVRRPRFDRAAMAVGIGIAVVTLVGHAVLTSNSSAAFAGRAALDPNDIVKTDLLTSITKPGGFLLAHVLFFGPIVAIVAATWFRSVRLARTWGIGLLAVLGLAALYSVAAESRKLVSFVPFVVVLATEVIAPRLRTWHVVAFGALSLAASKVWLPINHGPYPWPGKLTDYPSQYLFRNIGPWMSGDSYAIQGAIAIGVTVIVGVILAATRASRADTARAPVPLP
jgi:hypothetical protein